MEIEIVYAVTESYKGEVFVKRVCRTIAGAKAWVEKTYKVTRWIKDHRLKATTDDGRYIEVVEEYLAD